MKSFWKTVFATVIGICIFFAVLYLIFIVAIIGSITKNSKKEHAIKENSVLVLNFNDKIPDYQPYDFNVKGNFFVPEVNDIGLVDILNAIERAKEDENIKGILIETMLGGGGYGTALEIREALEDFKNTTDKFVISYSDNLSQSGYYITSVSDKVFMNPEGMFEFKGLYTPIMFYKHFLDKLDINVNVFRPEGNKFKSAVEPLILDKMSEANKEQLSKYLTSLWGNILNSISDSRGISVDSLNYYADNLSIVTTYDALEYNFIDGVIYYDSLTSYINSLMNVDLDKDLNKVTVSKYKKANAKVKKSGSDKIAVIYAEGEIVYGKGKESVISNERLIKEIVKARKDDKVKAVVFRVNSPGGSALASDLILREIELTKKVKPVIASYGNYAASGGYYISCLSDKIVCNPNCLTGSIGVFGVLPNISGLLNNKLGITTDKVKTNANSEMLTMVEDLSPASIDYMNKNVNNTYQTFIGYVARGRNKTLEYVDSIGQGRVWLGTDAISLGLVDEIGGLKDAIDLAATTAGLSTYDIVSYPEKKDAMTFITELFKNNNSNVYSRRMAKELGALYPYYEFLKSLEEQSKIQARLPYIIEIN